MSTPTRSLNRLIGPNGEHISTVRNVSPGYSVEGSLGRLHTSPRQGTVPQSHCVVRNDNFPSGDVNCAGQRYVSRPGWFHPGRPADIRSLPLMRCMAGNTASSSSRTPRTARPRPPAAGLGWISTG
ncbi:hypothetical protein [Streptomyces subrutilus]|uniref:hypothetical protein n=1 Tax=Streptomyces subrutilus TaxID=36818 RepID=UPI00114CFDEB|nr:hypothetical protein [Streptomyces subrutilus]